MIQPIKLQHFLNDYIKTAQPLISSVFISNMDGSSIASTNIQQQAIKEQILQANMTTLFDDCQEIGRIKLSNTEEESPQGTLKYAIIEHDEGISIIGNHKNLFIVGVTSNQNQKIGMVIKHLEKIKTILQKDIIGEDQ